MSAKPPVAKNKRVIMPRLNLRDPDNLLTEDLPDAGCSSSALFRVLLLIIMHNRVF